MRAGSPASLAIETARPSGEPIPGLVWAFRIRPDGSSEPLPVDLPLPPHHDDLLWLHFNLADSRALQWLASAEIRPPARALLLSKDTYQQLHTAEDNVYGVISDLMRDIDDATEDTGYLRFVMTEEMLISGRHQPLCAVDATRRALEGGLRVDSIAALFEIIVENIADTMERIMDRIAQVLDEVEEKVLSDDTDDIDDQRQDLGRLRRTCVRLHRQLSGLRIVFHRLDHRGTGDIKPALQVRAGKLAQRLDGLDQSVVEMRERSRLLQEELHLKIEQQGNNSLRVLSVLTALLLPPTLVSGFFGMNTKGLPFVDDGAGTWWAAGAMVLASLAAYLLMKRIGLIR
jgi:zinc transporter